MALVAGVDSSTQSVKVELRDVANGELVASGRAAHPEVNPPCAEQDPRVWWQRLCEAFAQASQRSQAAGAGGLSGVVAVAVAGQQHGFVTLDSAGEPVRPAKLWNDTTSADVAARLVESLGAAGWAEACGSVPVASFTITKLAAMVQHEPHLAERVAKIMLPHDYLTLRLTGVHVTDRGDASGTGWFDTATGAYRVDLLDEVGGRPGRQWLDALPEVLAFDAPAGTVTPAAAKATGLREGIPVGAGTGDNMAAALGLGLRPGDVAVSLGTSGTAYAVSPTPTHDPSGHVAGFCDAGGAYLPLVCTLNATRVTDTVAGWLGQDRETIAALALQAPPGANGVVLVPYFDGERTPNLPDVTGLFAGLRNTTTPADLARAAHEGVIAALLAGVSALQAAGAEVSGRLHLIGGGARSAAYRQVAADCLGAEVRVPDAQEMVALGACAQAAMHAEGSPANIAEAWNLGAGPEVESSSEGAADASRAARAAAMDHVTRIVQAAPQH